MKKYLTSEDLTEVAGSIQTSFEFNLTSVSSIPEVARVVREELSDRGWPTRRSLCLCIAKLAKAMWQETIFNTRNS